jgi:hypothetical protein
MLAILICAIVRGPFKSETNIYMKNATHNDPRALARRLAGALALAACFVADVACAVTLNPRGVGQALIYPYYTVNKGQDTLVSITNVSEIGKAIQVRLREGHNGRDVLSFVLFLGAHDTWTAALSQTDDLGGARITTSDTSCTRSSIPHEGVTLRSAGYDGTSGPADGGPADIWRTREGSIEFIVGGDIAPGSATDLAIKPPTGGGAPDCSGDNFATFEQDLDDPTSGIYGSASIVNVGQGTLYGYDADALQGLADDVMFLPGHPYPGPSLADASTNNGVDGTARAYVDTTDGHVLTLDYNSGIDAVSAVFMVDAIYNEYVVADSLGANTDWVVTFPTKHFYVDSLYGAVPRAPFENAFGATGSADVAVWGTAFDREQNVAPFGMSGVCELCAPVALPYEVNVIGVGQPGEDFTTAVLGSTLDAFFMPPAGDAGNVALHFATPGSSLHELVGGVDEQSRQPVTLHGLPVTGFMVYNIINAHAQPGMLANYGGLFSHRTSVSCNGDTFGCQPN